MGQQVLAGRHDNDDDLTPGLRKLQVVFSNSDFTTLLDMILFSGKGYNQFGLFDSGLDYNEALDYAVIGARYKDTNQPCLAIGLGFPKECNSDIDFQKVGDLIKDVVEKTKQTREVVTFVEIPSKILQEGLDTKAFIMIFILAFIGLLGICGTIVQYTPLFNTAAYLPIERRKTKIGLFFLAFSPPYNLDYIFDVKRKQTGELAIVYGIKVLSICWIIIGQCYFYLGYVPIANALTLEELYRSLLFGLVPGAFFVVDIFYYITGLLVFYLLTTKMYYDLGSVKFWKLYLHRYYRLIFPLMFLQGIMIGIMPFMGDGPVFRQSWGPLLENCDRYWWTNFLFINNLVPWSVRDQCIGWVYYLANDMQFFLMTPPIIYLYCRFRKVGYILLCSLIGFSMIYMLVLTAVFNVGVQMTSEQIDALGWMYAKPWARWGPYFVGAIFGLSYFELKNKDNYPELKDALFNKLYARVKKSKYLLVLLVFISLTLFSIYVFPLRNYYLDRERGVKWPEAVNILYNTTARSFFVFGLSLAIFPMMVGKFQFCKKMLSSDTFYVLSKLSYSVFLIHLPVLGWMVFDTRQPQYTTNVTQLFTAFGTIVASHLLAVPFTGVTELPFKNLAKFLIHKSEDEEGPQKEIIQEKVKRLYSDSSKDLLLNQTYDD